MRLLLLLYFINYTGRKTFCWCYEVACITSSLLQVLYHPISSVPQKTIYIVACAIEIPLGSQAKRLWEKLKTIYREKSAKRFFFVRKQFHFYLYSATRVSRTIIISRQNASRADPQVSLI